jgi:hypothetical protein
MMDTRTIAHLIADPLTPTPEDLAHINKDLWPLAVPIDSVRLDPENAKKHSPENLLVIKTSLQRFGQFQPLVADNEGILRVGNGRWSQMRELNWRWIAVAKLNCSYEEAVSIGLIDNKSSEGGIWNHEMLAKHLHMLQGVNFDLAFTGFQTFEIEPLLQAEWAPPPATGDLEDEKGNAKTGAKSLRIPVELLPVVLAAFERVRVARRAVEPKMTDLRALECLCLLYNSGQVLGDVAALSAPATAPQPLVPFAVSVTVNCPACTAPILIPANFIGTVACPSCAAVPYQVVAPAVRKSSPRKTN